MKHIHVTSETVRSDALALYHYLRLTKGEDSLKIKAFLQLQDRFGLSYETQYQKAKNARAMETFRALDETNWKLVYDIIVNTR
jgi:hypothetical protein